MAVRENFVMPSLITYSLDHMKLYIVKKFHCESLQFFFFLVSPYRFLYDFKPLKTQVVLPSYLAK